jgi:hypothetical protein
MRMWMVPPKYLCRKHLLGSHVEIHMFIGSIRKDISMKGYLEKNLLEPKSLKSYHDELVEEMKSRGWKHNTIVSYWEDIEMDNRLGTEVYEHEINKYDAAVELFKRCTECRCRYLNE